MSKDAVHGEARMKSKTVWTKWFCNRRGIDGDWVEERMHQLPLQSLPGPDFVFFAPNVSFDK